MCATPKISLPPARQQSKTPSAAETGGRIDDDARRRFLMARMVQPFSTAASTTATAGGPKGALGV